MARKFLASSRDMTRDLHVASHLNVTSNAMSNMVQTITGVASVAQQFTSHHANLSLQFSQEVATAFGPRVRKGEETRWCDDNFRVPSVDATITNSFVVTLEYKVKVTVDVPIRSCRDLVVELPIVVDITEPLPTVVGLGKPLPTVVGIGKPLPTVVGNEKPLPTVDGLPETTAQQDPVKPARNPKKTDDLSPKRSSETTDPGHESKKESKQASRPASIPVVKRLLSYEPSKEDYSPLYVQTRFFPGVQEKPEEIQSSPVVYQNKKHDNTVQSTPSRKHSSLKTNEKPNHYQNHTPTNKTLFLSKEIPRLPKEENSHAKEHSTFLKDHSYCPISSNRPKDLSREIIEEEDSEEENNSNKRRITFLQ